MPQLPNDAPPVPQGFAYAGHGYVPHHAVFLSQVQKEWIPAVSPCGVDVCVPRHFALPVQQGLDSPATAQPVQLSQANPATEAVATFQVGASYWTRSVCDHDCIFRITVASRSRATITTTDGKRLKVREVDGVETVMPLGRYSMAPVIRANRRSIEEAAAD